MKIESNLIPYNSKDLITACNNINQLHTYLKNEMRRLSQDDKIFLLSIFEDTFAGEVLKGLNKKKPKKKEAISNE